MPFASRLAAFLKGLLAKATTVAIIAFTVAYAAREPWPFLVNLVTFAVVSLAAEAFFTAITKQLRRRRAGEPVDWRLPGEPFLWSFLVYGLSATLTYRAVELWCPSYFGLWWPARGFIAMLVIYVWEYYWGWRIEDLTGTCPWKYRESPWRIWRYVNPYYFWSWFAFSFVLESLHFSVIPRLLAP